MIVAYSFISRPSLLLLLAGAARRPARPARPRDPPRRRTDEPSTRVGGGGLGQQLVVTDQPRSPRMEKSSRTIVAGRPTPPRPSRAAPESRRDPPAARRSRPSPSTSTDPPAVASTTRPESSPPTEPRGGAMSGRELLDSPPIGWMTIKEDTTILLMMDVTSNTLLRTYLLLL